MSIKIGSKKRKIFIAVISIIIIGLVLCFSFLCWIGGIPITHHGLKYAEKYRNDVTDNVMFDEDDFGEYADLEYQVRDRNGIWRSIGSMYIVKYTPEQYEKQINSINQSRAFLTQSINDMPKIAAEENGWTVRVEKRTEEGFEYPHRFTMIGSNDEQLTILYMAFNDNDFDGTDDLIWLIKYYFDFDFE